MKWPLTSLGSVLSIKHGWAFKGEFFSHEGEQLILTPGNFEERGGLRIRPDKEKYYLGDYPKDYLLRPRDILVAMTDLKQSAPILGASLFVPPEGRYLHNQRLGLVSANRQRAEPRFLYHVFNWDVVRAQIRATATGSTVRHTSPKSIYRVEIPFPPLSVQHRIADILSAYDDLIENNRRRMALLEESVHLLYREWFVRLRFPGHESVKVVEGLPEGWARGPLETVAGVNEWNLGASDAPERIEYIDISSVSTGRIDGFTDLPWSEAPSRARRRVRHGDIIWAMVRPANRAYAMVFNPSDQVVVSTGFAVLTPSAVPPSYLYSTVTTDSFVEHMASVATGASYPAVKAGDFAAHVVVRPPAQILSAFDDLAAPCFAEADVLRRQNQKLAEARDLLLPRLMDGSLPV